MEPSLAFMGWCSGEVRDVVGVFLEPFKPSMRWNRGWRLDRLHHLRVRIRARLQTSWKSCEGKNEASIRHLHRVKLLVIYSPCDLMVTLQIHSLTHSLTPIACNLSEVNPQPSCNEQSWPMQPCTPDHSKCIFLIFKNTSAKFVCLVFICVFK